MTVKPPCINIKVPYAESTRPPTQSPPDGAGHAGDPENAANFSTNIKLFTF